MIKEKSSISLVISNLYTIIFCSSQIIMLSYNLGLFRANPLEFLTKPIAEVIGYDKNASCKFLLLK